MSLRWIYRLFVFVLAASGSYEAVARDFRSYVALPFLSYHQKGTPAQHFYVAPDFNCQNRTGLKEYFIEFGDHRPTAHEFLGATRLALMKLRNVQFPIGCRLEINERNFISFRAHAVHRGAVIARVNFSTHYIFLTPNKEASNALVAEVEAQLGGGTTRPDTDATPLFWSVALRRVGGLYSYLGVGRNRDRAREDALAKCRAGPSQGAFRTRCVIVAAFAGDEQGCVASVNGSRRVGAADLNMFYVVTRGSGGCRRGDVYAKCQRAAAGLTSGAHVWDCRGYRSHTRNDALSALWPGE